jgi:hypothetical protein
MSITSMQTALTSTLSTAVGSKVTYSKLPNTPPARFPALMVRWLRTVPAGQAFNRLSGTPTALSIRQAKRRVHEFNVVLLIAQNGNTPDEDADARTKAQALIDAIDVDAQLGAVCTAAQVTEVTPQAFTWDQTAVYAVEAKVEITEDI